MALTELSASALSAAIHAGHLSCRELMQATLARIDAVNPTHNAIVSPVDGDVLLREADARDAELARGASRGWMHGLPQAIKDIALTAGLRTTSPMAATSWAACATPLAGTTSSDCARARAACRCGRRPTCGSRNSVPKGRWAAASKTSRGCSMPRPGRTRACPCRWRSTRRSPRACGASMPGARASAGWVIWMAICRWSRAFSTCASRRSSVSKAPGCAIEPTRLGHSPEAVWQAWLVWRRWLVAGRIAPFLLQPANRALIKPEALWEHDQAAGLTGAEALHASAQRSAFYQHMLSLFERVDVLALPSAQVWPFDAALRWPSHIDGREMDTYHRWMEVVIYATFAGLPCISVPAGFSAAGLPMGLQLIGRPQGDAALLQLARLYEDAAQDVLSIAPSVNAARRA